MTTYYSPTGTSYDLGDRLGYGGQANIFNVRAHSDLVAKIYTSVDPGYHQKLALMVANPPVEPQTNHRTVAWPQTLLLDAQGHFVGYLMPRVVNAVKLLDVLTPKERARVLPGFNARYLQRTALNLAIAFSSVHAKGYVVGDVNESNAMVTNTALVTLIDADSFQVLHFLCPVGKPDYTPPELFGQELKTFVRSEAQDCFGLGVLIFMLLMNGRHPFAGRWTGTGDLYLHEKIRRGWCPYFNVHPDLTPPPGVRLDTLDPNIVDLLRRCFVAGHSDPSARPSAAEWADVLRKVQARQFAYENLVEALQADDDDRIAAAYHPALDTHPHITTAQRTRLALAQQRHSAYCAFQPILSADDDQQIAKSYNAALLDPYSGMSAAERQRVRLAQACVNMPKRVRAAIQADDDEAILRHYNAALERPFTCFTQQEHERIEFARQRWSAYTSFRQALATANDFEIVQIYDANKALLNGYPVISAVEHRRFTEAVYRVDTLIHLRTALLNNDEQRMLQLASQLPVDSPCLLTHERRRIAQTRRSTSMRQRLERAIFADDDEAILCEYDAALDTNPSTFTLQQRKRIALAQQRAEATRYFRIALASGSDERIMHEYSPVLDQDKRITIAERERLALARRKVAALQKFRTALASDDDERITQSYRRILDSCSDITPTERARHALATLRINNSQKFLRAIATDDDDQILAAYTPELENNKHVTKQQHTRYELACRRTVILQRFQRALQSNNDALIAASFDPLLVGVTQVTGLMLARAQLAQRRMTALQHLRQALSSGASDSSVVQAYETVLDECSALTPSERQAVEECRQRVATVGAFHTALSHGGLSAIAQTYSPVLLQTLLSLDELKQLSIALDQSHHSKTQL